jgi:hypothetical protein
MASRTETHLEEGQTNGDCFLVIVTSWPDNPEWPDQVERIEAYGPFHTIEMMKRANDKAGFHFFDRDAMRFFRSRIAPGVTHGRVFITSEQFDYASPRLYTVRALKDDGSTADLSGFQRFDTLRQARAYVRKIYT